MEVSYRFDGISGSIDNRLVLMLFGLRVFGKLCLVLFMELLHYTHISLRGRWWQL